MPTWSRKLARPIAIRRSGPTLTTLSEMRAYIVALPEQIQERASWQHAAGLLLAAADDATRIEDATAAVEAALFLEAKWVPK